MRNTSFFSYKVYGNVRNAETDDAHKERGINN